MSAVPCLRCWPKGVDRKWGGGGGGDGFRRLIRVSLVSPQQGLGKEDLPLISLLDIGQLGRHLLEPQVPGGRAEGVRALGEAIGKYHRGGGGKQKKKRKSSRQRKMCTLMRLDARREGGIWG